MLKMSLDQAKLLSVFLVPEERLLLFYRTLKRVLEENYTAPPSHFVCQLTTVFIDAGFFNYSGIQSIFSKFNDDYFPGEFQLVEIS